MRVLTKKNLFSQSKFLWATKVNSVSIKSQIERRGTMSLTSVMWVHVRNSLEAENKFKVADIGELLKVLIWRGILVGWISVQPGQLISQICLSWRGTTHHRTDPSSLCQGFSLWFSGRGLGGGDMSCESERGLTWTVNPSLISLKSYKVGASCPC